MLIDRRRTGLQAAMRQAAVGHRVAGVFDPYLIPGTEQGAHGDVDGVLRAGGDDHLVGIAAHGPRRPHVVAHSRTQLRQAARIGVTEIGRSHGADRAQAGAAPCVLGALVHHAAPGGERLVVQGRLVGRDDGSERPGPVGREPWPHGPRIAGGARGRGEWFRQVLADKSARTDPRGQPAFGDQLIVGRHHRGS